MNNYILVKNQWENHIEILWKVYHATQVFLKSKKAHVLTKEEIAIIKKSNANTKKTINTLEKLLSDLIKHHDEVQGIIYPTSEKEKYIC